MMLAQNISSLDEAKTYIDSINFSMVIDKIVSTKKWKRKDVEKICELYRHFLYITKKYHQEHDQLPPSEEIDEFWHNHILDTHKYIKDCDAIFGKYLHHYPYFGIDGKSNEQDLQNAFEKMQEIHEKEFGEKIYRVRSPSFVSVIKTCGEIIRDFFTKRRTSL